MNKRNFLLIIANIIFQDWNWKQNSISREKSFSLKLLTSSQLYLNLMFNNYNRSRENLVYDFRPFLLKFPVVFLYAWKEFVKFKTNDLF